MYIPEPSDTNVRYVSGTPTGIRYGILLGLINIIVFTVLYISPIGIFQWWTGILALVLLIVGLLVALLSMRKQLGGYLTFKQGMQVVVWTIVVSSAINTVYNYLLYNYIDPSLSEQLKVYSMEFTQKTMVWAGAPQEEIDKTLDQLDKQDYSLSAASMIKQFFWWCLFELGIGAVLALIARRNPPEIKL